MKASRELAWTHPELLQKIQGLLDSWSEDEFVKRLPDLRLAFADLTPMETDKVGEAVSKLGGGEIQVARSFDVSEAEMLAGASLNAAVQRALEADCLLEWAIAGAEKEGL